MQAAARVETADLWLEYRETRDFALRNRLVLENLGLVYRLARQYARLAPDAYEDMVQEGCLALIRAVERFRPEYGLQFSTYAYPVISGMIKNFLRDRRRLLGRLRLEGTGQAQDEHADIGETLTAPADLDVFPADAGMDFTDRVVDRVLTDALLTRIPPAERKMLRQVFYEDLSQREIADKLARSASRISRILRRALIRLRSLLVEVQREETRVTAPMGATPGRRLDSFVDEETGLFGPGYLYQCLASAIRRADAYRAPVTLALLQPPSLPGDSPAAALSTVAERVYRQVRVMDHVFRAGSGELALIFPLSQAQAATVCARITNGQIGVPVTCSLASYPEDAGSVTSLLESARMSLSRG